MHNAISDLSRALTERVQLDDTLHLAEQHGAIKASIVVLVAVCIGALILLCI